jgi:hypothetical protein
MALRVNVVCRNWKEDRVLPRFGRYLADGLGWTLTAAPDMHADIIYLMGYFETQVCPTWPRVPVASLFTHREEEPPGNEKARLFDAVAKRVQLRVAMSKVYADPLSRFGPTIQPALPVERDRFTIADQPGNRRHPIIGLSGFTYKNRRKGNDLVGALVKSPVGQRVEWTASGRGWPVPTKGYSWADMPQFYQDLDVLVCTSRVEGGPMTVLEALACGVRVVIPRAVGILDELPDVAGIYRYKCGDLGSLLAALEAAAFPAKPVDREALRAVTARYTVAAWCDDHAREFERAFGQPTIDAGIAEQPAEVIDVRHLEFARPIVRGTGSTRGIYVVAFGDPARTCALRMMQSAKRHMPDIPIALCASKRIGPEDVLIVQPDSDVGGRRAKLRAYELAPAEWQSVLYLDADTEIVAPVYTLFQWVEDGWEFVICRDVGETLHSFQRKNNLPELAQVEQAVGTLYALQFNGGVWAFKRCEAVKTFMESWRREWEVHAQRDQGALIRALYAHPLRIWVLGNEWNKFPKYTPNVETAGILHYPGDARRWEGKLPGRIDGADAWAIVNKHERAHGR